MHVVFGANGPVGSHLVEVLGRQQRVRAWDGMGDLDSALAGARVVHYCVAPDLTTRAGRRRGHSPELTQLVESARRAGVKRIVHLSTTLVYGPPLEAPFTEATPARAVGAWARLARRDEKWLLRQKHLLEIVVVRCAPLFGDGEPVTEALRADAIGGRLRLARRGRARSCFLHVADAARAMQAGAQRGRPGSICLASGFISSWQALGLELSALAARPPRVGYLPYAPAYLLAWLREATTTPGRRCWPTPELVDAFAQPHLVDDSLSRRDLTWSPQVCSFAEANLDSVPPSVESSVLPSGAVPTPLRATSRRGRSRS